MQLSVRKQNFILFYFILFYFTLLYFTLLYFTLLYFTLFYFILFYFILFYKRKMHGVILPKSGSPKHFYVLSLCL